MLFLVIMALGASVVRAQRTASVPRIGVITGAAASFSSIYVKASLQAAAELGYVEGKNILIESRFAEGQADRLPDLVAELVRLKVDIIVAAGDPAIDAARRATSRIPIVMVAAGDPVGGGWVTSLAHPGGNITGTTFLSSELAGKRLELLKETVPKAPPGGCPLESQQSGLATRFHADEGCRGVARVEASIPGSANPRRVARRFLSNDQRESDGSHRAVGPVVLWSRATTTNRRFCGKKPASVNVRIKRVCGCWGPHVLWSEPS